MHNKIFPLNSLQWRHNERDGVSNPQRHKRLFRRRSKKTSTIRVTGLHEGNSKVTGEFPAQRASNAENVSIWKRHHDYNLTQNLTNNSNDYRASLEITNVPCD